MNILKMAPIYKKMAGTDSRVNDQTRRIALGIAWTWEYDEPFIRAIVDACGVLGLSVVEVTQATIERVTRDVLDGTLQFGCFFDRASDEDDAFRSLSAAALRAHQAGRMSFINPSERARRAADKATMHLEFLANGIHVPHTTILPTYAERSDLSIPDEEMRALGSPFVIKPANTTGGGTGVIMDGMSIKDVIRHRMTYGEDKYLLQQRVNPVYLGESRAWFRVFHAFGDSSLCWWDDQTHVYDEVTPDEERWYGLSELRDAIGIIARICKLDFFSSEFAQTADGTYVSVDYVNELCDMRPKSAAPDGIPDDVIRWVAGQMADHVRNWSSNRNDKGLEA